MALITGWDRSTWDSGPWNGPIPVEVTGVSAASAVGSVTVSLPKVVTVTGVSAASGVGSTTVLTNVILSPTGVSAASGIGSVQINHTISVEGVSAEGLVNNATVWSVIDTSQTPDWSEISTSQTPSWSEVSTSQTPDWSEIAA